jgi:benzoyl-CoA reductase/2-hydroxyglutaryl-CoA dehydratase subunit BcrC/BadD/HgdB
VAELLDHITERYFKIDCAVFTPNPSRVDHVKDMYGRYHAQGVIHYSLQFCHPYIVESGPAEAALEKDGIPTLRLETDYSQEDAGQLKTRIEAFRERIQGR